MELNEKVDALEQAVYRAIDDYGSDLSYSEVIGTLEVVKLGIVSHVPTVETLEDEPPAEKAVEQELDGADVPLADVA